MKYLILFFLMSCASAPKKESFQKALSESHPSCQLEIDNPQRSFFTSTKENLSQGLKTTGSYVLTTLGYTSDTIFIGGGTVGIVWLCRDQASDCFDLLRGYFGILGETDVIGLGQHTYQKTSSWRCPYVDHLGQAIRKVAACNMRHSHFVAAYLQLDEFDLNPVLNECLTPSEKLKSKFLRKRINELSLKSTF